MQKVSSSHLQYLSLSIFLIAMVATPTVAQDLTVDFGDDTSLANRALQLMILITVLSLAPAIAIMVTAFPFIVTVLAILRQGIGLQQSPPNMLIVSLAMFLTWYVMEPVFLEAWTNGVAPLVAGDLPARDAAVRIFDPFRLFMSARVDPETLSTLSALRESSDSLDAAPISVLVPSFLLSEIDRAFQVGFLIFLPFLVIDLVVAAVLMSMGMMMVPPAIVSLPFKLAFFVVADGWTLVAGALVRSYF